jgi:BirA family biotin operon repressor/biotin-[acetyl-CoA-carboxylase] ligase
VSFQTIESTSNYAKEHAFEPDDFILYLANEQTAGRGRGKNTWLDSGPGQAFTGTFKLRLQKPPQPILSPLIGLALFEAADRAFPNLRWSLKAPNDLYLENKKIAGLLIEVVAKGSEISLLVGLGFNVLSAPTQLESATSLCGPLGLRGDVSEANWFEFLSHFKNQLQAHLAMGLRGELGVSEKASLLAALERCPVKAAHYVDLTNNGDLVTTTGLISWKDL